MKSFLSSLMAIVLVSACSDFGGVRVEPDKLAALEDVKEEIRGEIVAIYMAAASQADIEILQPHAFHVSAPLMAISLNAIKYEPYTGGEPWFEYEFDEDALRNADIVYADGEISSRPYDIDQFKIDNEECWEEQHLRRCAYDVSVRAVASRALSRQAPWLPSLSASFRAVITRSPERGTWLLDPAPRRLSLETASSWRESLERPMRQQARSNSQSNISAIESAIRQSEIELTNALSSVYRRIDHSHYLHYTWTDDDEPIRFTIDDGCDFGRCQTNYYISSVNTNLDFFVYHTSMVMGDGSLHILPRRFVGHGGYDESAGLSFRWNEFQDLCRNLSELDELFGPGDWRIPTIHEFQTIVGERGRLIDTPSGLFWGDLFKVSRADHDSILIPLDAFWAGRGFASLRQGEPPVDQLWTSQALDAALRRDGRVFPHMQLTAMELTADNRFSRVDFAIPGRSGLAERLENESLHMLGRQERAFMLVCVRSAR